MVKDNNKTSMIILIVLLVLALFGAYWLMGFIGGMMPMNYEFGWLFRIITIIVAILVIYDVLAKNNKLSNGMKVLWVILAVFFSIITAVVYYLVGRNPKSDLFKNKKTTKRKK